MTFTVTGWAINSPRVTHMPGGRCLPGPPQKFFPGGFAPSDPLVELGMGYFCSFWNGVKITQKSCFWRFLSVSKGFWEFLKVFWWFLWVSECSWGFLRVSEGFWGFPSVPEGSWGFLIDDHIWWMPIYDRWSYMIDVHIWYVNIVDKWSYMISDHIG